MLACFISGLPNALGGYDETPEIMAAHLKVNAQVLHLHGYFILQDIRSSPSSVVISQSACTGGLE